MKMRDFELEVFFGKYEFTAEYLLTQSDCEAMSVRELLLYEPKLADDFLDTWLGYTEVPGSMVLREQIASLYDTISPQEIMTFCGAQEAIFAYMNVLLEKGDHVITMFPIYQSLFEVANSVGCEVSRFELRDEGTHWSLDMDELRSMIQENTKLIVINTPNNPTGYTLSEEEMKELASIAEEKGIYVFCDEVYRGLDLDGKKRPWMVDIYDKAVSLGVMSKAYGLAGLRIGWIAVKDKTLFEKLEKFKHYMSICNSSTSEVLALVALRNSEKLLLRNKSIIESNLKVAQEFFQRYEDVFENKPPMAGPIAFHKLKLDQRVDAFCDDLIEKKGVLLLPGSVYEKEGNYFRMGYGRKNFPICLEQLDNYLKERLR